eukprot:403376279
MKHVASQLQSQDNPPQHNPTDSLFHVLWLNFYTIFLTVYLIEAVWVINHKMILNKGSVLIITSTFLCLILKLVTYGWSVVEDIYGPNELLEGILSEIADFMNIIVYVCSYFFIFTLWKTYVCLSNEQKFIKNNKKYFIGFWVIISTYLGCNMFFLVMDIKCIYDISCLDKNNAMTVINVILNLYKLLIELAFTYMFIKAYQFLRCPLKTKHKMLQQNKKYDLSMFMLIILWSTKIIFSNTLYFLQVFALSYGDLYQKIFQYYRLYIIVTNFCFSTFLLWFLYLSTHKQNAQQNQTRFQHFSSMIKQESSVVMNGGEVDNLMSLQQSMNGNQRNQMVFQAMLYDFEPFPDQIRYLLERRSTVASQNFIAQNSEENNSKQIQIQSQKINNTGLQLQSEDSSQNPTENSEINHKYKNIRLSNQYKSPVLLNEDASQLESNDNNHEIIVDKLKHSKISSNHNEIKSQQIGSYTSSNKQQNLRYANTSNIDYSRSSQYNQHITFVHDSNLKYQNNVTSAVDTESEDNHFNNY